MDLIFCIKYVNLFKVKDVGNIGALEIGIPLHNKNGTKSPKVVYLLGCDDFDDSDIPSDAFVIYQGTHGDKGASRANIVLPGATSYEKSGTYISTEGRVNTTRTVIKKVNLVYCSPIFGERGLGNNKSIK